MILGAFHQAYKNKKATEEAIKSFRLYNDGPYFLVSDGGYDFSDIAKKYNCVYYHSNINLGYRDHTHPSGIYGMTKDEVLEWLKRFHLACTVFNSNHLIMMEDDVLIRGKILVDDSIEFSGYYSLANHLPEELVTYLTKKYDATFQYHWYGCGGGTIFKTKTFVENYNKIIEIFDSEFDYIKSNLCSGFGWVDIWMTVYYYLCNKEYYPNPYLTETTKTPNWRDTNHLIVHQYKEHYV